MKLPSMPATAPGKPAGASSGTPGNTATPLARFATATQRHSEYGDDRQIVLQAAASTQTPQIEVPAYGFARFLYIEVTCTTAGNAAATTFAADGPWNVFSEFAIQDQNGQYIFGPYTGYDMYLVNLFGGYTFDCDPSRSSAYTAVTGAGATGGSFSFVLRVPIEINQRDGYGALPNMSAASTYKVRYTVAPANQIYGVQPTALPTVRVRIGLEAWMQPPSMNEFGQPQATAPRELNTTQLWTKIAPPVAVGSQRPRLTKVGFLLRTLVVVFRDGAGARADANIPDPLSLEWDGKLWHQYSRLLWKHKMQEWYGYAAAVVPAGVIVLPFTDEFDGKPGRELGDGYVRTNSATRIELVGTWTVAGSVSIMTNEVVPAPAVAVPR